MSEQPQAGEDTLREIRELAGRKDHRLSPHMTGTRPLAAAAAAAVLRNLRNCPDKGQASTPVSGITKAMSDLPPSMSHFRHIPAGRYATPSLTGNNDFDFWYLKRPDTGKWAGFTFVERVIGGRENVPVRGIAARRACQAIEEYGAEEALLKFGQLLGICGDCGRHLTDEESRLLGRGPVCRSKKG